MKRFKRLFTVAVTASMIAGMTTSLFADTTDRIPEFEKKLVEEGESADVYSVTIESSENAKVTGHEYKAYQILKAEAVSSGEETDTETGEIKHEGWGRLLNADFGSGIDTSKLKDDLKSLDNFLDYLENYSGDTSALAVELRSYISADATKLDVSGDKATAKLEAGYYLIVDTAHEVQSKDTATSAFILDVFGDITVKPKADKVTVQKKLKDINDSDGKGYTNWQDVGDYDIGDYVPFQLKATLPSDYAAYSKYTLVFHDKLSKGLTFDEENANVKLVVYDGNTIVKSYDYSADSKNIINYSVTENADGTKNIDFTLPNLKTDEFKAAVAEIKSSYEIAVEFEAELNEDAIIGQNSDKDGNAVVDANGNPNTVYLEYSNNVNFDVKKTSSDTSNGGSDHEYKDDDNDGKDDKSEEKGEDFKDDKGEEDTTGETVVDGVRVYTYKVVVNKLNEELKPLAGAEFDLYKKLNGSYQKLDINAVVTKDPETEIANVYTFLGLDDGEYMLREAATPDASYSSMADVYFTVTAEHGDNDNGDYTTHKIESLTATVDAGASSLASASVSNGFAADLSTGAISTSVINKKGVVLPYTGGQGTKVIYMTGGALVLAASVLLVTKRRMRKN